MTATAERPDKYGVLWRPDEFDPDDLPGLLERLRFEMERVNDIALPPLRTGASEDQIRTALAPTGLDIHPDLITWFQWTTGPAEGEGWTLGHGASTPVRLEAIGDEWDRRESEYVVGSNYEPGRWMPFLETAGFDCGDDEFRGSIMEVSGHGHDCFRIPRLSVLVWWWIARRVEGTHVYPPIGDTQFDSAQFGEVVVSRTLPGFKGSIDFA